MTFDRLAGGSALFVDANILVYAFAPDPVLGPSCQRLLERIELRDLAGFTSSHTLSDTAHRLMTIEACSQFGWPATGIAQRLRRHSDRIGQLTQFRVAIEAIVALGIGILPVDARHVVAAAELAQRHGLLSNDALIVALMQERGLQQIASHDTDFDQVPGITRLAPN